ncbi:MAG TPA: aspartate aminotransferase family protein [Chloroflexota bacterium]|jgi:adenosylmethionine-8-amino-7-oxononanoate aminotransferase|nr:aspartate aminotransferase family protein [Chloroflexota bacterium]
MVQTPPSKERLEVDQILRADREHLIHPLYHPADHAAPMVIVRGEGAEIIDAAGKRYFDALSGLWNVHVGHGRTELAQVAFDQMSTLAYNNNYVGFTNVPSTRLAEKLVELAYPSLNAVYFTTAGAESNESAFKTARFFWKLLGKPDKVKILSRRWGYHGVTMAAASATGLPVYHKMFAPLVPNFIQTVGPYRFRCELEADGPRPCTDPVGHDYAAALERTLLEEGPDTVAAILAEPVQGAGGVIVPPDDYWPKLRQIADRHNVLLIADEVITGFGRTGKWFALDHWNVEPDIMSFAKGVTSAYLPLGGIMVSSRIQNAINEAPLDMKFTHAATYSGHAACCAVGLANVEIIEREGLVARAASLGASFNEQLKTQLEPLPLVGNVRGLGLMAAVELADRNATGAAYYDNAVAPAGRVIARCIQNGILPRRINNAILMAPPLISTEAQVSRLVEVLAEAIQAEAI